MGFKKGCIPWNKGKKVQTNTGKTHFKKGVNYSPNKKKTKYCEYCKTGIIKNRGLNRKYCSHDCYSKSQVGTKRPNSGVKGEKNPLWNGGVSRAYKTGYYSQKYKNWRKAVFVRDDFICQECGTKNIYITAHHIKSFAHYPELRFNIDNGVTLCEECHAKTDNYKGRNKKKGGIT